MRSARYFAADHGIRLPTQDDKEPSEEKEEAEGAQEGNQTRTAREQRPKPDWFLHDDRDMDPGLARRGGDTQGKENQQGRNQRGSGWDDASQNGRGGLTASGRRGGRGERPAKPHVPGRTVPLLPPSSAWHYIDPEGKEQGPFDAKKLTNWVDLGYFGQSDLQVRKEGKDTWVSLSGALPQIRKEAAGDFSSSFERAKEPVRGSNMPSDDQAGRGRGRGAERGGDRPARPARRSQQDDLLPVMPQGKRHPAEGLLSPRDEATPAQRSQNRRGADHVTPGPDQPSRVDQYPRGEAPRGGRGRGKAARGGRTARTDAGASESRGEQGRAAGSQSGRGNEAAKPPSGKTAWKLFTAERKGTEAPMWRYIDPDGQVQGPFNSNEMHTWFESNYLQMELPICGMERMVSPPDLPPKEMYKPLGQLLQQVERGQKFRPVTVKEIAAVRNASMASERTSNDGAESVEAKQEPSGSGQQDGSDSGSNQDAESVQARGGVSEDESDMEEGEIHGRTAATDEESDFDPDEDDGSVSSPRRPVQNQAARDTTSPERPASPQKAEAKAALRRPASPDPVHKSSASVQAPASPVKPTSPVKPASPERPEVHAARTQGAGPHQAGASSTAPQQTADISMPGDLSPEQESHKPAQAAEPSAGGMIVEEPEEEEQAAAKQANEEKQGAEQQESGASKQDSMQIEEMSQEGTGNSGQAGESGGVMQSMVGAAKSLLGGGQQHEQDKQAEGGTGVDEAQEPNTSNAQAPTIEEPDTTESEATVDSHHSEHGTFEVHEAVSRSNSGADDIGPAEDLVGQVQEGMQKVSLDDH